MDELTICVVSDWDRSLKMGPDFPNERPLHRIRTLSNFIFGMQPSHTKTGWIPHLRRSRVRRKIVLKKKTKKKKNNCRHPHNFLILSFI